MGRSKESVVYLDTHIVIWLYAGLVEKLSGKAKKIIEDRDLFISEVVRLELQYLFEIGRIKVTPSQIIRDLSRSINMKISSCPLNEIIDQALRIKWTRDVFDRLLAAEVQATGGRFVTADATIRKNLKQAVW